MADHYYQGDRPEEQVQEVVNWYNVFKLHPILRSQRDLAFLAELVKDSADVFQAGLDTTKPGETQDVEVGEGKHVTVDVTEFLKALIDALRKKATELLAEASEQNASFVAARRDALAELDTFRGRVDDTVLTTAIGKVAALESVDQSVQRAAKGPLAEYEESLKDLREAADRIQEEARQQAANAATRGPAGAGAEKGQGTAGGSKAARADVAASWKALGQSAKDAVGHLAAGAFDAYADSMGRAFRTGTLSADGLGKALQVSAAQSLRAIGEQSAIQGTHQTAEAIKALARKKPDPAAAGRHAASAAEFFALAAVAGIGAGAAAAGGGGGGGSGSPPSPGSGKSNVIRQDVSVIGALDARDAELLTSQLDHANQTRSLA